LLQSNNAHLILAHGAKTAGSRFMSGPLDGDLGALLYAPKRVRDVADAESHGPAPKSQEVIEDGDAQQSTTAPPASLEPTLMAEVCPVAPARFRIGVPARFAMAIAIVAVLTLFVVGKFTTPWMVSAKDSTKDASSELNARTSEQPKPVLQLRPDQQAPRTSGEAFPLGASLTGAAEGGNVIIEGLADGSTVTSGQFLGAHRWRIPMSDLSDALVQPPLGYVGAMDIVLELWLADDKLLDRKPLRLEWVAAAPLQVDAAQSSADLKQAFYHFVENYTASTGKRTFSAREREMLFKKFQQFLDTQMSTRSAR
jgi:hypothetical protein